LVNTQGIVVKYTPLFERSLDKLKPETRYLLKIYSKIN